jgi:hypothetical protein
MPREISLVSTSPLTLEALVAAGVRVDGTLVPRTLFDGWLVQLVDVDDVAVLSVELSRRIEDAGDLERLTGPLPTTSAVWWTEATAPWGVRGESGVRIARALGEVLGARVLVHEGQ